jgi:hypothetical protein
VGLKDTVVELPRVQVKRFWKGLNSDENKKRGCEEVVWQNLN